MENPISISNLNDFIFCPVSIFFHQLDTDTDKLMYQEGSQINGSAAHEKSDTGKYSSKRNVLQGTAVYSETYNLEGKIDIFDIDTGVLTERKRTIKTIYDGYVFQIYAQYFALKDMGYSVNELRLYSITDNKTYKLPFPEDNLEMLHKFESTIRQMQNFDFAGFVQDNMLKCRNCIYEPLCSFTDYHEE